VIINDLFPFLVDLRDGVFFIQPEDEWPEDMAEWKYKTCQRQELQIKPPIAGVRVRIRNLWRWGINVHGNDYNALVTDSAGRPRKILKFASSWREKSLMTSQTFYKNEMRMPVSNKEAGSYCPVCQTGKNK